MLVQLLNPTLFDSPEEMVECRHRLNAVVFRRTKADACRPDGSSLFRRRWVNTEAFLMSPEERRFYGELREYLEDGFALAKRQGNQGRALGFVMAIFQRIAASSFAAVRRTLRRRLLMLTLHEAILKDQALDIEGREALNDEARGQIREIFDLRDDPVGRGETDRILADVKLKLLKKLDEEALALASDAGAGERAALGGEDIAVMTVGIALPEERARIRELLEPFPEHQETKVEKLLRGLGALWEENPDEKIVIFATYLGTVDLLGREIDRSYPGQGVVVLRGGDHGAKLAAERKFRTPDGPRVLVCTAAGREGINLQLARVLFNFDLPWNPMDVEQRIGRIHRYGQKHTAQIYNLVLSDTIEGRIFLLLNDKLTEIARALGKVDEHGNIAEDLRSQILGQLSERIRYDKLHQEALSDPELKRTRVELEDALANASEARKVVFELFQDLDGFSLDEYRPLADVTAGMRRIVQFLRADLAEQGKRLVDAGDGRFEIHDGEGSAPHRLTTKREEARESDDLELPGLDHPLLQEAIKRQRERPAEEVGFAVRGESGPAVLSWWLVETHGRAGEQRTCVRSLAVDASGHRQPELERQRDAVFSWPSASPDLTQAERKLILREHLEPMLHRDLQHNGITPEGGGYVSTLIGWAEIVPEKRGG